MRECWQHLGSTHIPQLEVDKVKMGRFITMGEDARQQKFSPGQRT